jgi:ankyrin repeat protein
LSRAAENGDERIVKLLLENGAQPDFGDEGGQAPLSRAVEKGSIAVVQLLLAKEAKIDFKYNIVSEHHPYLNEPLLH